MSGVSRGPEDEVARLGRELLDIRKKRDDLDAREKDIYDRLARLAASKGARSKPMANGYTPSELPPLKVGAMGQADRLVSLMLERPDAEDTWLLQNLYEEGDTPVTRQRLASMRTYLKSKKGHERLDRINGQWVVKGKHAMT